MDKETSIKVTKEDHGWLKTTRGSKTIKERISEVIAKYKEQVK